MGVPILGDPRFNLKRSQTSVTTFASLSESRSAPTLDSDLNWPARAQNFCIIYCWLRRAFKNALLS